MSYRYSHLLSLPQHLLLCRCMLYMWIPFTLTISESFVSPLRSSDLILPAHLGKMELNTCRYICCIYRKG